MEYSNPTHATNNEEDMRPWPIVMHVMGLMELMPVMQVMEPVRALKCNGTFNISYRGLV